MKKIISILFLVSSYFLNAQTEDITTPDASSTGKGVKADKISLTYYTDIWKDVSTGMNVSSYSPGFNCSYLQPFALGSSNFGFAIGLGIGSHNMRSDAMPTQEMIFDTVLVQNVETGKTIFEKIPENVNNKKIDYDINKLTLTYLDIPLEIRFYKQNKNEKVFKLALGFKAGYLISSHTKYKGNDFTGGTDDIKIKKYNVKNLELLRYGATVRLGYENYNIFGYYSMSKLFKLDKGPEMYPISVGISVTIL